MGRKKKQTKLQPVDPNKPDGLKYHPGTDKRFWRRVKHDSLAYAAIINTDVWTIRFDTSDKRAVWIVAKGNDLNSPASGSFESLTEAQDHAQGNQ